MSIRNELWFRGWRAKLALCLVVVLAIFIYSERRAPGAGTTQPLREFFLPQFGHGGSSEGLSFSSTITLINLSTTTSQISVASFGPTDNTIPLLRAPDGSATPSLSMQIPANGTATIQSMNSNPDQIDVGTVAIFSFNDRVVTQTEFSIFNRGNLAARAQVAAREPRQKGSFPIAEQGRTGLAVLNPFFNSMAAEVLLASVTPSGDVVDTASIDLMPGHQISRFLDQLMDVQGATSAEFRSNVPVNLLPLQQDNLVLTTQDLFPGRNVTSLFNDN